MNLTRGYQQRLNGEVDSPVAWLIGTATREHLLHMPSHARNVFGPPRPATVMEASLVTTVRGLLIVQVRIIILFS